MDSLLHPPKTVEGNFESLGFQPSISSHTPIAETLARTSDVNHYDIGQEATDFAPVWTVYNEESIKFDTAVVDSSNRNIDVLLVFTGLFSAVLTTFIIQAYQLLLPNPLDATNVLIMQFIRSQMNNETATPQMSIPASNSDDGPTMLELRWVNGLWFAALACSLSAALFSMLAKQWLQAPPNFSGSPRQRARQRQRRHMQMQAWHVLPVINALPLLLHATLLLFFAGLLVLLWTGNHAITIATSGIVALVFACYFALMLLSLLYPDCPYQHPISEQLRHWIDWRRRGGSFALGGLNSRGRSDSATYRETNLPSQVDPNDLVDACSLIWLLEKCPNPSATAMALQAIAGLPRNFTAFHLLRKAGAINLVLREFRACFHRDSTLDSHWYVTDPEKAEKYCRAWMRLSYRTPENWPFDLLKPLEALQAVDGPSYINVTAVCTRAVINAESRDGRPLILSYLGRCTKDPLHFSHEMQCWLIDTFLQCSLVSRMRFRPKEHIVKEAVPILVHLFHFTKRTRASHVRSAVGLSLSYLTGGSADLALFEDEELRKDRFYELIIPSLSTIINDPAQYGADKTVLDLIAKEFSMLTSLAFSSEQLAQKPKRSEMIRPIAQRGLWKLFADAHIKHLPSDVVSCVLQVMYPPAMLPRSEHPQFVKSLLSTLSSATETKVMVGALRLLEPLFLNRHPAVLDVFIQGDGISSLLRVARLAETGQRRLQLDCIRKICLFIRVVTECFFSDVSVLGTVQATKDDQLDYIFQSEFLMTLNQVVTVRGWWLPEVADIWMPALLELCKIRPGEAAWQIVVPTLRKFAEANEGKQGCLQLMSDLENMQMLITPTDSESGEE